MTKEDDFDITDLDPDIVIKPAEKPKPKKKRRHLGWGGTSVALLIGIAGLLGGRLGQLWPSFDIFAQFGPQFLFLVVAFALAVFMPRMKTLAGLTLFLIACAGYGLWPQYVSANLAKGPWILNPGERAVRVAHFNLYRKNQDLEAIALEIERLAAEVVTLIEFTPDKAPLLARLRVLYPYQFSCHEQEHCHFAILSKQPISEPQSKTIWEGPPYIQARIGGTLGGIRVMGVHTTRFPHSRAQLKQVTALVKELETQPGRIIMMGDFNATPYSRITSTLEEGAGLTRLTNLPTWPSTLQLPQLAIDHIFVSGGIRALSEDQIGQNAGSDHFPIVMTLGITMN